MIYFSLLFIKTFFMSTKNHVRHYSWPKLKAVLIWTQKEPPVILSWKQWWPLMVHHILHVFVFAPGKVAGRAYMGEKEARARDGLLHHKTWCEISSEQKEWTITLARQDGKEVFWKIWKHIFCKNNNCLYRLIFLSLAFCSTSELRFLHSLENAQHYIYWRQLLIKACIG